MRVLLDATAIVAILLSPPSKPEGLNELSTLDLAFYEVGNAIWKAVRLGKSLDEGKEIKAIGILEELMENLRVIPFREIRASRIVEVGIKRGLTFYDSSYLVTALDRGMTLVTDDRKLSAASMEEGVKVIGSDRLLALLNSS